MKSTIAFKESLITELNEQSQEIRDASADLYYVFINEADAITIVPYWEAEASYNNHLVNISMMALTKMEEAGGYIEMEWFVIDLR